MESRKLINLNASVADKHLVGKGTRIHSFVEIGPNVYIGYDCNIQAFCFIPEGVTIGNRVFIGPHTVFLNDKHPPSHGKWRDEPGITVGNDVSIGGNCTILPGVILGDGCKVGAGAVVTKDVAPGVTVVGTPARPL